MVLATGEKSVLVINGPNLNLLGLREPHLYGSDTLDDAVRRGKEHAKLLNAHVEFLQSNWEGEIIDRIQAARVDGTDGIILNPAGFTHTSVTIRDALLAVEVPFIELHVSNIHAREDWRHHSYFSDKAKSIIVGCGIDGYQYGITQVVNRFPERKIGGNPTTSNSLRDQARAQL